MLQQQYEAIIADTETTGFKENEVVELAWMPWPNQDHYTFRKLYKPVSPLEYGAIATHHLYEEKLEGCEAYLQTNGDLPLYNYIIGHNIDYDWKALGQPKGSRICTLALSRHLWPECDSHKLSAIYYYLNGCSKETEEVVRGAHSALDDVLLTKNILHHIIQKTNIHSLERLYALSEDARIPRVMTFGKHKDQPISAVDRGYANWYRRQPDTDPYVIEAFRRAGLC